MDSVKQEVRPDKFIVAVQSEQHRSAHSSFFIPGGISNSCGMGRSGFRRRTAGVVSDLQDCVVECPKPTGCCPMQRAYASVDSNEGARRYATHSYPSRVNSPRIVFCGTDTPRVS